MRISHLVFFTVIAVLSFSGCSQKNYFEPEKVEGKVAFDKSMESYIKSTKRDGATLENGRIITKESTPLDVTLPEDFDYVSDDETSVLATGENGKLLMINKKTKKSKEFDFGKLIVSAKSYSNRLALVLSDNTLMVVNSDNNSTLFKHNEGDAFAIDSRHANPYFLKDLILFPSLDGKIVAVDSVSFKIVRRMVVKSGKFFDNIIFLEVLGNRMVAATQKRIISVSPEVIDAKEYEIRDVIFVRDGIYIFTTDGQIIRTSLALKEQKSLKFPFAVFVGSMHGRQIYGVEREGYLIAVDPDLKSSSVYELDSDIDEKMFSGFDRIYFRDKYIELKK